MSAQIICCMTVVLQQWVNGLMSCLWIFPTLKVATHTASGWGKLKKKEVNFLSFRNAISLQPICTADK